MTAGVLPEVCAAAALQSSFSPSPPTTGPKLPPRDVETGLPCFAAVIPERLVPALRGLRHARRLHWVAKDSNRCLKMVGATHQWSLGAREGCHPAVVLWNAYAVTSPGSGLGCCHHKRGQLYLGHRRNKAMTFFYVQDSGLSEQCWTRAGCSSPMAPVKSYSLLVPSSLCNM